MTVRRLRPVNLTPREEKELGLLLSLLGDRAGGDWRIEDRAGADAAIVDLDAEGGHEAAAEARRSEGVVIVLSGSPGDEDELRLSRPLRSEALIRVLSGATRETAAQPGAGVAEPGPVSDEAVYRLRRWPGTELLRREWRYTRVCGALGRGPQSMQTIARRTGIDAAALAELVEALADAGCIERTDGGGDVAPGAGTPPPGGLFGRIRARLGRA